MKTIHNVLYVDDEQDNLAVFTSQFRKSFNVFTANSAQSALDLLGQNDVHVIIADQRMPEVSGIQLLEQVRERFPDIIRIILTAYTESEDIIDAINRGAVYAFVQKPWTREDLGRVINLCVSQADMKRRSKITVQRVYESAASTGQVIHQFPSGLRALLVEQRTILDHALSEPDQTHFHSHLELWRKSLDRIDEAMDEIESEYLRQKTTALPFDESTVDDRGFLDEDLVFTLERFRADVGMIHRLHFTDPEFRQLCRDYYECSKALGLQKTETAEFALLSRELENDIRAFLERQP